MFNSSNCAAFICWGDYNTSFEIDNAQSRHLSDYISRNDLSLSWDHVLSEKDFTYVNHSLSHKLCIDHFILSNNVYDYIVDNSVIFDSRNLSNHNIVELRISCFNNKVYSRSAQLHSDKTPKCSWYKSTSINLAEVYGTTL